jgi:hypothetical protein
MIVGRFIQSRRTSEVRAYVLLLSVLISSQSLAAQRSERACRKTPVDSSTIEAPVYHACHTDRAARERGVRPRMEWQPTPSEVTDGACFRADFEFVVDTLGVPEVATVRVVRSSNPRFTEAARARIVAMRYLPAQRDGHPVRQVVQLSDAASVRRVVSTSPSSGTAGVRPPRC